MVVHHRQAHAVADDELTFHHWVVLFDFAPDLVVGIRQSGTAKLGWVRDARADARLGGRSVERARLFERRCARWRWLRLHEVDAPLAEVVQVVHPVTV